tara:strand:+ start:22586 stop:22906 length:321 start_codon:yes stop_codon:yes gene_type:complete
MATWKSKKRKARADIIENFVDVECRWEYQTTADVFSYYEILEEDYYGYGKIEKGSEINKISLGPEAAMRLYHALASWTRQYNSEKDMMSAIENNMFDWNEELDGEE